MFSRTCRNDPARGLLLRSPLRRLSLFAMATFLCVAGIAGVTWGADLSQAVVRQKVNVVTVAPNLTAPAEPAAPGAVVRDQTVVRTGTASKAKLEFSDLTRTRLTANAIFTFDAAARA